MEGRDTMKYALTVLVSVVLALLATWYAIAARVRMLARAPEQATVLVVPGSGGACVPRVARPVIKAHIDDAIEWRSVELPGCEAQGAFDVETGSDEARLFAPVLQRGQPARERAVRVTHGATAGVTVTYTVELANGQHDTARIVFF
jgi:hypothetical protein